MAKGDHTFTGVCIHKQDHVYIPAVADVLADKNEEHALIFRWIQGQWAHRPLAFSVSSVCQVNNPPLILNIGIDGQIDIFSNPGAPSQLSELIDTSENVLYLVNSLIQIFYIPKSLQMRH